MPEAIPYGQEPAVLRAGENLIAHRTGRYYSLTLPEYSREATDIIREVATAFWERSDGAWRVRASRHETLQKAMDRIAAIPGMDKAPVSYRPTDASDILRKPVATAQKTLILADTPCEIGQILTYRRKAVAVEHIGRAFTADSRYAKWGKPELCGKLVRYATHHPASAEEIAAWEQTLEERGRAVEPAQDHAEAAAEPEF